MNKRKKKKKLKKEICRGIALFNVETYYDSSIVEDYDVSESEAKAIEKETFYHYMNAYFFDSVYGWIPKKNKKFFAIHKKTHRFKETEWLL